MTTWRCPQGHDSSAADWCDVCGAPIGAGAPADVPPDAGAGGASVAGADNSVRIGGAADARPGGGRDAPSPADAAAGDASPAGAGTARCPHCGAPTAPDLLFCEACGADLTTGAPPPPPLPPPGPDQVVSPSGAPATPAPGTSGGTSAGSAPGDGAQETRWVAEVWVDPDWFAGQDSDEPCPSAGAPVVVPLRSRSVLVGRPSASRNIRPDVDCGADTGVSRRHAQLTTDGQRWWVEDLQSANGTYLGAAGAPLPTDPITPGQRREVAGDERIYVGAWTRLVLRAATDEERASF
jgi:hypothetical protein